MLAKLAACQNHLGQLEESMRSYEMVVEDEPDNLEYKMELAAVYEQADERGKAMDLVQQGEPQVLDSLVIKLTPHRSHRGTT